MPRARRRSRSARRGSSPSDRRRRIIRGGELAGAIVAILGLVSTVGTLALDRGPFARGGEVRGVGFGESGAGDGGRVQVALSVLPDAIADVTLADYLAERPDVPKSGLRAEEPRGARDHLPATAVATISIG